MSLSVCLVTRNEERNLSRALRSVADVATEMIVADTGSTDRTLEVARAAGARAFVIPWDDDFAAARDAVFREATSDWILFLNPDEELLAASQPALLEALARDDIFGFHVLVQELQNPERPQDYGETIQIRLFRRREDLHSIGRLHSRFDPSLAELAAREGKGLEPTGIVLRRHAYLSQPTEDKVRWVVRLLERELRDRPDQLAYQIEYGRNLLMLNDLQGHEVLAAAAEKVLAGSDAAEPPTAGVQGLLEYLMTVAPEFSRSKLTAAEARELALRWYPASPPILSRAAEMHFRAQEFDRAAELLERLLELGRNGTFDRSESFDTSLFGEATLLNLTACYLQLGKLETAEPILRALIDNESARERALHQMGLLLKLRRSRP